MNEFFSKRITKSNSGCWVWNGTKHRNGYGLTKELRNGRYVTVQAHRLSWKLANGPIPEGKCVLHKCDNPPCCNPAHLFIGSFKENTQDSIKKGRWPDKKGENAGNSKITNESVNMIRELYNNGSYQREIAIRFKIDQSAISRIINKKRWSHV